MNQTITTRQDAEAAARETIAAAADPEAAARAVADLLCGALGIAGKVEEGEPADDAGASRVMDHDGVVAELIDFAERIDRHGFVHALGGHARTLREAAAIIGSGEAPSPWRWCDAARPEAGRRVIMLYEDGSGAMTGYWTGDALIDAEGDERDWPEEMMSAWAYLPEGQRLWCEMRGEDPFTFPEDASTTGSDDLAEGSGA